MPLDSLPRLAIVLSHASMRHSPWFRWLRSRTSLVFRVFYLDDAGLRPPHKEKSREYIPGEVDLGGGYDWEIAAKNILVRRIADWAPEAVMLCIENSDTWRRLQFWAWWRKIPVIRYGGTPLHPGRTPSAFQRLRDAWSLSGVSAFACEGVATHDDWRLRGVPEKDFSTHHGLPTLFASIPVRTAQRHIALALRVELGIHARTRIVLFAGRLIPEEQPLALLKAFAALNPPDTALLFIGEGSEKPDMLAFAATAPAELNLQFLPFASATEMPSRYLLADLYVKASRGPGNPRGRSVGEAVRLGVPCLVSDRLGCQRDWVIDGESGWVFRGNDTVHLKEKLAEAIAGIHSDNPAIRAAVQARAASFTYEQSAAGLFAALRHAVSR